MSEQHFNKLRAYVSAAVVLFVLLTVAVNNETFTLNANDAMTAQMDVPHSYSNTSDSAVTFTMTVYEKSSQR